MKLKHVIVTGFKSMKSTVDLLIDDNVTIMIGANDHGKSNLLEAILRLNPDKPITNEDRNWDISKDKEPRIEWHFLVEGNELAKFVDKSNEIRKSGEKNLEYDTDSTTLNYFPENPDKLIVYYKEGELSDLKILSVPYKISKVHENSILQLVPKVEDFLKPISTKLKDDVTLTDLNEDDFEFMQGIFQLAGIWKNKDTLFTQDDPTSRLLDTASRKLTSELNKNWDQGKDLKWKLVHAGSNGDQIQIRIKDPSVKNTYIRPSARSSGFQTFFILTMMINARTYARKNNSYIFLFDEPGIYLHPHAQLDLQRSFESISQKTQIIYTTHSLFLVNKNHPSRNRVISKTPQGTKVDQKPFQKNWKSVRTSLGILFSNNFLIADKTLLVEGPSDVIYILSAIKLLKSQGKSEIDLNDFSIVDAGSSENYLAIAKVMLAEGGNVVALVDGDRAGTLCLEKIKKACEKELNDDKLTTIQLPVNKSTEDVFADVEILRQSIRKFAEEQTSNGLREYVEGFVLDGNIGNIKDDESKSLGYVIKEETKKWFKTNDELSKLSIALIYDDLANSTALTLNLSANDFIRKIQTEMGLRGEKSADRGVFREIK